MGDPSQQSCTVRKKGGAPLLLDIQLPLLVDSFQETDWVARVKVYLCRAADATSRFQQARNGLKEKGLCSSAPS